MKVPTGEAIIDEVVNLLRRTKTKSAADIALHMEVLLRDLSIAIKMLTGIPLNDMVLEWRMLQAKDLLDDKSLSLRVVADRCGFRRNKNLIIAFRRRWGTTPQAYRTGRLRRNCNYVVNRDNCRRLDALRRTKALRDATGKAARQSDWRDDEKGRTIRQSDWRDDAIGRTIRQSDGRDDVLKRAALQTDE